MSQKTDIQPATRGFGLRLAFRRVADTILLSLCKLHEIQFSAPWNPQRPPC